MIRTEIKNTYVVKEKVAESATVSTLTLAMFEGKMPAYNPGQFITIYFPELNTPEGKAYSMSGAPDENTLTITVKAMGEFSNRLCGLRAGDTVVASLPYGYFYSESKESTLVMVAAGIGITPFRSMIQDLLRHDSKRTLMLFYSARTNEDLVFKEEFDRLQKQHRNFAAVYFVTREKSLDSSVHQRRMSVEDILRNSALKNTSSCEFMICGAISFVSDIWKGLRAAGVPEEIIYTEAFFAH